MSYTREQAEEVLKDYNEFHYSTDLEINDIEFLNHKFPKLPETGLVVYENGMIVMRTGKFDGYGFSSHGRFDDSGNWNFPECPERWHPATEADKKRWEELLEKEAKRRGYVKGAKVRCLSDNKVYTLDGGLGINNIPYWFWLSTTEVPDVIVMRNGKWAEIIEEQPKEVISDGIVYVPKK